jgi:hypothetical protein|tara:strand:- start:129 stop:494 length:366 start_codon:yes stop_codon:yes gene_type:complete
MATLTTTITLTSSDAMTDSFNLSLSKSLTVTNPIEISKRHITIASAAVNQLVASSDSNFYYVYLKNTDDTNYVSIKDDAANTIMRLHPGEFAFFTLESSEGLEARADTDTITLEYGLFKKG